MVCMVSILCRSMKGILELGWMADHDPFYEQEGVNPYNNIESFDAIYFAVLQVVIVAGANGVSSPPITQR